MATLIAQFGIDPSTASATSATITPTATLPVGSLVVVGASFNITAGQTMTVSDSGGNTWTRSQGRTSAGGEDTLIASAILTTALTTSSTITLTMSSAVTRHTAVVAAFSDAVTAPVSYGTWGETSSTTVTGGTVSPANASLLVACTGFVSSGRVFTAGTGWTASTKHLSTFGSGDRAVQLVWRDGVAATSYNTIGTINSGGIMLTSIASVTAGVPTTPGWPVGVAKVWTGSAWTAKPVKVWSGSAWVVKTAGVKVATP